MKRHVLLTGEVGSGKSTALLKTLALLGGVRAAGIETYYPEPRGAQEKSLYMRAWGNPGTGQFLTRVPGSDNCAAGNVFDTLGCALLKRAQAEGELIVIDEIGRLEKHAGRYQAALARCLEGDVPMLCTVRKLKAPWADWIRSHPAVTLIEVTQANRDEAPFLAAQCLGWSASAKQSGKE